MDEVLRFHILGVPVPQGSKKGFKRGKHIAIVDDNAAELAPWRANVSHAAYEARVAANHATMDGPVALRYTFVFPRTKAARRRDFWKAVKPDGDKLERALWDGMTDAGVYRDDGQVVDWGGRKRLALPDHPNDPPGVYVVVGIPENPLIPAEPEQPPIPDLTEVV